MSAAGLRGNNCFSGYGDDIAQDLTGTYRHAGLRLNQKGKIVSK